MGLLLGYAHFLQNIENSLALHFQFPGEIVDSNLAHPAFLVLRVVLRSSSQPHGVSFLFSHALAIRFARAMLFGCFRSRAIVGLLLALFAYFRFRYFRFCTRRRAGA